MLAVTCPMNTPNSAISPARFQETRDEGQLGLHRRGVAQRWQAKRDHSRPLFTRVCIEASAAPLSYALAVRAIASLTLPF